MLHPRMRGPEAAVARYGELAQRWSDGLERGDRLADEVAADMADDPRVGRALRAALADGRAGPDAPASVQALIDEVSALPARVDPRQLARAGRAFFRTGAFGGIALGAGSLVGGYTSPEGNKPLIFSGRLLHDVTRRLAETATYVVETHRPGSVLPGGKGWALGVHVRVMHAVVRRRLQADPRWQPGWGVPINQHDLAATQLLFSIVWLEGLRALGWPVSREEAEDHLALWRVAGRWMGVDPTLMPADEPAALEALALVHDTEGEPDDDARRLVAAMLDTTPEGAGRAARRRLSEALIAHVQGPARSAQLGLRHGLLLEPALRLSGRSLHAMARASTVADDALVRAGLSFWESSGTAPIAGLRPAMVG